jgi:hypothetical protein
VSWHDVMTCACLGVFHMYSLSLPLSRSLVFFTYILSLPLSRSPSSSLAPPLPLAHPLALALSRTTPVAMQTRTHMTHHTHANLHTVSLCVYARARVLVCCMKAGRRFGDTSVSAYVYDDVTYVYDDVTYV